jgi:transmembrane sensor
MKKQTGKQLLAKLKDGTINPEELALLETWYNRYAETRSPFDNVEAYLNDMVEMDQAFPFEYKRSKGIYKLWPRFAAAVSIVIAIAAGIWFYTSSQKINRQSDIVSQNDIAPGSNKAILMLNDGQLIPLSNAKTGVVVDASKIAYNDGSVVNKSTLPYGGDVVVSTPRGGTYQVILSDGTRIWLNAASKIEFPATFSGKQRQVTIAGEAYLEVAKDKAHPFIVKTRGQKIEVLGTHFNINSYADDINVKTTLLEGSVRVSPGTGRSPEETVVLKPNQQSVLTGNAIQVQNVEPEGVVAWKNGLFMFEKESLSSIMRKISRWYNVNIEYEDESLKYKKFGGTVSRFDRVSKVLRMLELTGEVRFKIEGQKIIVTKY